MCPGFSIFIALHIVKKMSGDIVKKSTKRALYKMGKRSCIVTYHFSRLFNSAPMRETTLCFECGKTYSLKSEKDRKIKEKLHKKFCSNGKIVTFK